MREHQTRGGEKGKFPEPGAAGPLPGRLQGSAVYTRRLLIHIVGLKIEVLAAAQLCSEGWEKRNAPTTSLPPAVTLGLGTSRWRWACQCHLQKDFLHAPNEKWEEMPVKGAALQAEVCFFSSHPPLGSITLGSGTCFPSALKLSCLHCLNGKRQAGCQG